MKFTIDIEDFYLDEDDNIEEALRDHIIGDVVSTINKQISEKIQDSITAVAKSKIEKVFSEKTSKTVDEFIENGTIRHQGREVSVEEYIKYTFNNNNNWEYPESKLTSLAEKFGDELKNRYDLFFATQIVKKLGDAGLLSEGIAKAIIDKEAKL